MPFGSAQVEAARLLWEKASPSPDPAFRFAVLDAAITAAVFGGASAYAIALFPLLLDVKRTHPAAVPIDRYVWILKWLVGNLTEYPEVPRTRIERACDEYVLAAGEAGSDELAAAFAVADRGVPAGM